MVLDDSCLSVMILIVVGVINSNDAGTSLKRAVALTGSTEGRGADKDSSCC